jgi:hypothetical protein
MSLINKVTVILFEVLLDLSLLELRPVLPAVAKQNREKRDLFNMMLLAFSSVRGS